MRPTATISALLRSGNRRNDAGRAATPSDSSEVKGSSAPSSRRAPAAKLLGLLAITMVALFAAAAPASAATAEMGTISNVSYGSAHVTGKITTSGVFGGSFAFQYSTDGTNWNPGLSEAYGDQPADKTVAGDLLVPKGSTEYFVRLIVESFGDGEAASPAAPPYPSFTTLAVEPPTTPGAVAASPVFSTSATATGKVKRPSNPDPSFDVSCHFEYLTDQQFTENETNAEPLFAGAIPVDCAQNPITDASVDPEGEEAVSAPLADLSPSTTYHLRLTAENTAPGVVTKEALSTFTTEPKVAKPTVLATDDVTEPGQNTAKVSGEVQRPAGADPALDIECRFEYISDEQFTENEVNSLPGFEGAPSAPCTENPITAANVNGEGKRKVSAELGGLKPGTTYHLRLAAVNGGGVDAKEAAGTFTTVAAELPIVTIDSVAGGTYTTAHVSGAVDIDDPGHQFAPTQIEISTDNANWSPFEVPTPHAPSASGGVAIVEHDYTELQPSTTYFFRISAKYAFNAWVEGEANGEVERSPEPNPSITTGDLFAPTATINPVNPVTGTTAHLSGAVDPHAPAGPLSDHGKKAFATKWEFVCMPECPGQSVGTVQGEEGEQPVAFDAKHLEPNTAYEVTLVVTSEGGTQTVGPELFETPVIPPTVRFTPGASDGQGGYTLQGVVNPNNSPVTACKFEWGPTAPNYAFSADCSPAPGEGSKPVTVEAHLSGLSPGATYHAKLVIAYGEDTKADGGDQTFVPTLVPAEACPNETLRKENNSLDLPECRAYEMVSPPNKSGFPASLVDYTLDGTSLAYYSQAGNIANSGGGGLTGNDYVATRTDTGWQTIADLNGSSGSPFSGPEGFGNIVSTLSYSADLRSSLWFADVKNTSKTIWRPYLRNPDGTFTLIGGGDVEVGPNWPFLFVDASDDLSHVVLNGRSPGNDSFPVVYGPGVYEFVGVGNDQPRRVDLDNLGDPVSECSEPGGPLKARGNAISRDGRVIFFTAFGGCGGTPPANELWARVGASTSYDVSASLCTRSDCNGPVESGGCSGDQNGNHFGCRDAHFQGAAEDGSRVYFTTTEQLLDGDTDQTNDLYACDIPPGSPAPVGDANPCSSLRQVSGPAPGARVESVTSVSDDGSAVYFLAQGVLADNEDALKETAAAGDHNLYVWRTDAAHPAGQTAFVARLDSKDIGGAQTTPDGRCLVFTTANQLVPTDTDNARDVYRYDADTGVMDRVSINVLGVGGNADDVDAAIKASLTVSGSSTTGHSSHAAVSDDGDSIVFLTAEALSPLDGNGQPDVYLWKAGHVSLISTGSVGSESQGSIGNSGLGAAIDGSGHDIYFNTVHPLTPGDGDDVGDVYDARIGGGFSAALAPSCSGETCQSPGSSPPIAPASQANRPKPDDNFKPCPKGKVAKGNKCVKKAHGKHHKKGKGKAHQAGHNRGDSK